MYDVPTLTSVIILYVSKFAALPPSRKVIVPPYCGLPSLSHQFPVVTVDFEVAIVGTVVGVTVIFEVEVEVDAGGSVGVVTVVAVDVLQEAKTSDIAIRQVSTIQIIPLFIQTSFFRKLPGNRS